MKFNKSIVFRNLILLTAFFMPTFPVFAQASPSATPTDEKITKQIEDLKDRLATKVAELRQTEKRATSGTIKTVTLSSITIETELKDIKLETNDDIIVIDVSKGSRTKKTIEDVVVGQYVVIFGQYDTTLEILSAKIIVIQNKPQKYIAGIIKDTDNKKFTITISADDGREVIVDYEKYTKTMEWNNLTGFNKSGFSKIIPKDRIFTIGIIDDQDPNRMSASRILTINTEVKPTVSTDNPSSTSVKPTKDQ